MTDSEAAAIIEDALDALIERNNGGMPREEDWEELLANLFRFRDEWLTPAQAERKRSAQAIAVYGAVSGFRGLMASGEP